MKLKLVLGLFVLAAAMASGAAICPGASGANNFAHAPDSANTGCNTLITFNANGTITVTVPDASPYDGVEDTLVGVLNNSSAVITSISLSGSNIFGLDGDGICVFTFVGNCYCSASAKAGTDPQDYYGPTSTFAITNANNGIVNFAPGIAADGGSTFFRLEEPPTVNLIVNGVPEPGSIVLRTGGLAAIVWMLRRRRFRTL